MKKLLLSLVLLLASGAAFGVGCTGTGSCYFVINGSTCTTPANINNTLCWATTSGGAVTGGLPGSTDDCYWDSASNNASYTVTVNATNTCRAVTTTAPSSGNLTFGGGSNFRVFGNISLYSGMIWGGTGTSLIPLAATSGSFSITTNGVSLPSGGISTAAAATTTWTLNDNLTTLGSVVWNCSATCTLVLNGKTLTTTTFSMGSSAILSMDAGTIVANGNGGGISFASGVLSPTPSSTSVVRMAGTGGDSTFTGNGNTLGTLDLQNTGSTIVTISGNNTFNDITSNYSGARTVKFTTGSTQHFANWHLSGSSGNLITLDPTTTTGTATIDYTGSGVVSANYLTLNVETGDTFNCTDTGSTNTKWYLGTGSGKATSSTVSAGCLFLSAPTSGKYRNMFQLAN